MLREFNYKDKNRRVMVTKEDDVMLEGIDFSYVDAKDEALVAAFVAKYDGKKKLEESELDLKLTADEKQAVLDAEKAEWAPYMKYFRRYNKVNILPKKEPVQQDATKPV